MPDPIPFSDRLPEPDDCSPDGRYWCSNSWIDEGPDPENRFLWTLSRVEDKMVYGPSGGSFCTHWLPFHALPLPTDA
jgi:hypothetical protein